MMARPRRVSRAFRRRSLPDRGAALRHVIATIDQLHRDGSLNRIDLWYLSAANEDEYGKFYYNRLTGEPFGISVKRDEFMAFTFCHEVGHFLDLRGISGPALSYASEDDARLTEWRAAIRASAVWNYYDSISGDPYFPYTLSDDTVIEYPIAREEFAYVVSLREFFARSYAQWVATRSGDTLLMEQLQRWRAKQLWILQWDDEDFVPVGAALDTLMVLLGWRTDDNTNAN